MKYEGNKVSGVKIAYIGGGSRGWAWGLMSDLAAAEDMSGEVALYDIDREAAARNEVIGNRMNGLPQARSAWNYHAANSLGAALDGADFVVISILPGTFDEMESDVHAPEAYGIYHRSAIRPARAGCSARCARSRCLRSSPPPSARTAPKPGSSTIPTR